LVPGRTTTQPRSTSGETARRPGKLQGGLGLSRLRVYREKWDESRGVWKDRPRHDDASQGADAFLAFACSSYTPPASYVPRKRILRGIV
jgi:hypothetical protein